ncbi:hypothetical protein EI42_01127 [Thermosporothrix hazakensis]|jgi:hypothetical protein|uniref:Uncharacterized protein n=1 Tax=Thermosporothrix hazakensis TaxID=644383 RepID=A0A326UB32_THEHA|nr:hypothetical protein [Thermosporothrix hazakensis]PZW34290.1 hypothetical protein EI42_01127 [Thermosporothrix hazakensis]GCE46157.1 hypothetical protein KTH_10260 [Thermosporothrix hazakensis]
MSTKADYTTEEWNILASLPYMIGATLVAVSKSGAIGKTREALSLYSKVRETTQKFAAVPLIQELFTGGEVQVKETRKETISEKEQLILLTFERCRAALTLLESKTTPEEVEAYKQWLYQSAERIAGVSKGGGFLGIGAKRIDEQEATVLAQLREILGVQA